MFRLVWCTDWCAVQTGVLYRLVFCTGWCVQAGGASAHTRARNEVFYLEAPVLPNGTNAPKYIFRSHRYNFRGICDQKDRNFTPCIHSVCSCDLWAPVFPSHCKQQERASVQLYTHQRNPHSALPHRPRPSCSLSEALPYIVTHRDSPDSLGTGPQRSKSFSSARLSLTLF